MVKIRKEIGINMKMGKIYSSTETFTARAGKSGLTVENIVPQIYEWNVDITQDGIPDKIVVNTEPIFNAQAKDLNTIKIYSGKTGNLIWQKRVTAIHPDWLNVSLYQNNGKDYILIWDPAMWQGRAVYSYQIINLSETGQEIESKKGKIDFNLNNPIKTDIERLENFSGEVNQYLNQSFILADTINGRQIYSTPYNKVKTLFVPTEEIEAIRIRLEEMKTGQ